MVPSFLLALREGLEAALIIGILLGTLKKIQHEEMRSVIWWGVLSAVIVSLVVATTLYLLGTSLEGAAEEAFEGIMMLVAAGVLTWMIFWMYYQAQSISAALEEDVRHAVFDQKKGALFFVAFLAVVREGIELALFLMAASFAAGAQQTIMGAVLGLGTVGLLSWSLFNSLVKLDLRRFFIVTSVLLVMFAAGLVAHGVHELNEVGWIPVIVEHVWDTNYLLNENSFVGEILKTLFGYNANPSLTELFAYLTYFLALFIGLRSQRTRLAALRSTTE